MATEALKSTIVTNADASIQTLNKKGLSGGVVKIERGTIPLTNGADIGSTYRFARIPSRARIVAVKLYCDAVTTCAADFGLYRTAADGGAVVDADAFASAQSLATAILTGTEIQHESGVYGIEDSESQLWQIAAATSDPNIMYDITATLTAAAGSAGDVTVHVLYTDGD